MATTDPRIDAYINNAAPFARPILMHLRKIVHTACPNTNETMKWAFPHFDYKGEMMCSMAAFKEHAAFGFWKSKALVAQGMPELDDKAIADFGRLKTIADLPDEKTLIVIIKAAAALTDAGVRVERPKAAPKAAVKPPAYFTAALKKNKKALAAYEKFSQSHQREYVEWITEAKTDATRERRLTQAVTWLAEGKPRNWKYV